MMAEYRTRHSPKTIRMIMLITATLMVGAIFSADAVLGNLPLIAAIFAMALSHGVLAGDLREARWPLLFQLPVHPVRYYYRVITRTLLLGIVLLSLIIVTALILVESGQRHEIAGTGAGILVFFVTFTLVSYGISSVIRNGEVELTVLYLATGVAIALFLKSRGVPEGVRDAVSLLFFPIDAILTYIGLWRGTSDYVMEPHYLPQLIFFPAAWLALITWRLSVLNRGE